MMIWLLPLFLLALTLLAMGLHRSAATRFGDVARLQGRPNHSLSLHPAARRGHTASLG